MRNFIQNLKNLKSLTQIFRNLDNLGKANLVNLVNFVMQFFNTSHCSTVSVMAVGQPTNRQDISNLSPTMSPAKVAVKSRISSRLPLLALLMMLTLGAGEMWGADCNYTVNNFVSSKNTQTNGDQYRIWVVYKYKYYDYYDVPTFEFGNVINNYGISHVKLSLKFGGLHAVTEKFQLQYKVGNGGWTNIGSEKTISIISTDISEDVSIAGASGQKVYFRLERVEKAKFTDTQTLTLSGFEVRMASTISASESSIDFGNVTYGSNKSETVTAYYTLNYSGNMTASISGTNAGDYSASVTAGCDCSTSQQSKTVTVTFTPTQAGTRTATLTITNPDDTNTTVSLTGTGVRANPTLNMNNDAVDVTTDIAHPATLNLVDLKASGTTSGIGDFTNFEVISADASTGARMDGTHIENGIFYSTVGGTYTVRATTAQNNQYNSTYKDFTVTVNRLTQTISWSSAESVFVEEDVISATSIGDVTLEKSGAGAEYVTIEGNTATVDEVEANSSVTLTATAAQTDVYAQATDSKTITLTSLQKQHITFTQNLTKLKTTDGTKKVQLIATSDSNRDSYITFAVDANSAGVTVTHENDKWYLNYTTTAVKGIAVTASLAGVEGVSIAASDVSQMVKVTDPNAKCDINETLATAYGIKSTTKEYDLTIPKDLVLKVRCSEKSLNLLYGGYEIKFYNAKNQQVGSTQSYGFTDGHYYTKDVQTRTFSNLDKNITKMVFTSNAGKGYDITEASYTRWSYANTNLSVNRLDFEALALSTVADQTFTLDYANYQVELSIEGSSNFVLKSADAFGDCETYGTETIKVGYNVPAEAAEETAYLYVRDNTGTELAKITLHATVQGGLTQNITSTNIQSSYLTTDLVNLTATTDRGLSNFTYSAIPTDVAVFNGSQMTFVKSGTIAITVTEAGNNTFDVATETVNNVVVSKVTPVLTAPTSGTEIRYLETLGGSTIANDGVAKVTLRGEENTPVTGSWTWSNPTQVIKDNAGTHTYEVTFTPTDGGMYTTNTCMVPVTILRAEQFIEMNNGTVKVAVGGIDEGKADSKIDLDDLIASQTSDIVNSVERAGTKVTYEVISDNKADATIGEGNIFSATVCDTYTIRATLAATEFYNVATADFTITVGKRANTMVTAGPYTKYVDDEIATIATVINSDGTIRTSSSDASIAYYDVENNKIVIPNSEAKSFNQTDVTIKIWQDATLRFVGIDEEHAKTITLTVKKYDNPFACSWNAWSYTANFEEVVPVEFTTANTDYAHSPIVISQTSGENVATLESIDATHNTITASYVRDDATWHLSQAENYKYKAGSHDVTLQVRTLSTTCYIFEDNSEHSFSTEWNDFTGHYDDPIAISGPAKAISFEAIRQFGGVNNFIAEYSVDNCSSWRTIMEPDLDYSWGQTYTKNFSEIGLEENERVTHIRFGAKTGATLSKWYRNIKVTRATNIKPLDKENNLITAMTMPQNTVGGSTTEKFYMKFSTCDDVVKLASNNPHFTLDKVEIENDPSLDAVNAEVTVTYSSNELGTHNGVITLYTKYQNRTFTVSGTTAKKVQTIEWKEGFTGDQLTLQVGLEVNNTNIAATASSGKSVIYTTDNESVIEIILNGLGFKIIGEGSATLTASEAGDGYWESVSETKSIIATNQQVQTILWDQDLVSDMTIDQEVVLDAKVYIRDANGDLTYNAERTAEISYSCPENDVISLVGKTITIQNYGQTTITATVAGTNSYAEAQPVSMTVLVREPSAVCETPLVLDHSENVRLYSTEFIAAGLKYTTPEVACQIELSPSQGKPDKLSYKHNGEEASIPVFGRIKLCNGTVKVQERVNGHWDDVEGSSFNNNGEYGAYNWRDVIDLQLNENADAIRFVREEHGSGAHNFKDIKITLRQYIRPVQAVIEAGNVLDIGNIEIGEARNALVQFDYSDVKGDIIVTKGNTEDAVLELNEKKVVLECGSHGQYDLPVTLHPTEEGEWSNTITLTDNQTNATTTITIRANVILGERYVFIGDKSETGNQWGTEDNWFGSNKPGDNANVIIRSDVEIAGDVSVKSMTISEGATVTVTVTGKLTIGDGNSFMQTSYGDLHIAKGGSITMGTGTVMVRDFILDASLGNKVDENESPAVSGQFSDENNSMIMDGDAYFDLTFDPEGRISYGWYDFTVPFPVNVNGGIARINSNNDQVLENNTDFIVMEFDEQSRANGGKGWRRLYNGVMQPGKLYSITFDDEVDQNTFRFTWNGEGSKFNGESYAAKCTNGTADASLSGWNGLGNGMLSYGYLGKDGYKLQAFNHTLNKYELVTGEKTFAVGTAFFVQVDHNESIDWVPVEAETKSRPLFAPKYNANETEEFLLTLHGAGAKSEDALYFSASEEATEAYVIGHDLLKMGTPTEARVAQMWTTKGGHVLCDVEAALNGNTAYTPLTFFAPKEGNYKLAVEKAPEDADLFLTYKGNVIWNLSSGPYAFKLTKGTTEDYGLRIEARIEQVTPGNNNGALGEEAARKVLINNMLYIVSPEGKIYDATGKSVQ